MKKIEQVIQEALRDVRGCVGVAVVDLERSSVRAIELKVPIPDAITALLISTTADFLQGKNATKIAEMLGAFKKRKGDPAKIAVASFTADRAYHRFVRCSHNPDLVVAFVSILEKAMDEGMVVAQIGVAMPDFEAALGG